MIYGFMLIKFLWESYVLGIGINMRVRMLNGIFYGKVLGIDDEGVFFLEMQEGIKKIYFVDIELG